MKDGLTSVDVAGVDGVVDDAVLVELVVQDLHLDLEELVLPAYMCSSEIMRIIDYSASASGGTWRRPPGKWKPSKESRGEPDGANELVRCSVAGANVLLLNKLVAGIRDGDGRSRDPEPAVPGPGGHVRRRDGPAGTRPAGAHHHPVLAIGAGAPMGGARPRGEAGELMNEAGHCDSASASRHVPGFREETQLGVYAAAQVHPIAQLCGTSVHSDNSGSNIYIVFTASKYLMSSP